MGYEKIEEIHKMAQIALGKQVDKDCTKCAIEEGFFDNFEALYDAGYRKEIDTAREILAEAKKWVKAHYKDKVTDSFGEREMLFMEAFGCLFEYLKEKYEVE